MLKRDLDQITPKFVEAVEDAAGSSSVGWDCIDPRELILAVLEVAESRKCKSPNEDSGSNRKEGVPNRQEMYQRLKKRSEELQTGQPPGEVMGLYNMGWGCCCDNCGEQVDATIVGNRTKKQMAEIAEHRGFIRIGRRWFCGQECVDEYREKKVVNQ